jgi:hypothetical protein
MKKTISLMLLMTFSVFAGKIPANFSSDVDGYVDNLSAKNTLPHRSGLLNSSTTETDDMLKKSPSVLFFYDGISSVENSNRNQPEYYEYEVRYEKPDTGFIGLFKHFTEITNLKNRYYDTLSDLLTFIPNGDAIFNVASHYKINREKSKESLVASAQKKVTELLPAFKGRIEFDRTDITYQNGSDILAIDVWFRRIFKNSIVLDNVSAVIVSLNGDGDVTSLRVRWPKFIRIAESNTPVSYSFCKNVARDIASTKAGEIEGEHQAKSVTITGVARAWHAIISNDITLLTPCLSFRNQITMDDGELLTRFISVPVMNKHFARFK